MQLRKYQTNLIAGIRQKMREGHKKIIAQSPTGSGKTPVIGAIVKGLTNNKIPVILIVPRRELIDQGSAHLSKWGIHHNFIHQARKYNPVFNVHIASLQTAKDRWKKILPQIIAKRDDRRVYFLLDESHLNYQWQIWFYEACIEAGIDPYFIGLTATPERLDGKGLHTSAGGVWDSIVYGPSIPWLTQRGYLMHLDYYSLTIEGINDIKFNGTEWSIKMTEEFFKKNGQSDKIYGSIIGHYEKYAVVKKQTISTPSAVTQSGQYGNKSAIFFCRSVSLADELAQKLRLKGYNFQMLHGAMKKSERQAVIDALKKGEIDGVTSCDLITYGFDCPRLEYMGITRNTKSRPLGFQIWGRGTRPFTLYRCCGQLYDNRPSCPGCGGPGNAVYRKENCHVSDHVGLFRSIQDPYNPGIPGTWLEHIDWNFMGIRKKSKNGTIEVEREGIECAAAGGLICLKKTCQGCEYYEVGTASPRRPTEVDNVELSRINPPTRGLATVPLEERAEIKTIMHSAAYAWENHDPNSSIDRDMYVRQMIRIAEKLGYKLMWVYSRLSEGMNVINYPALYAIQRVRGYKTGWVRFQKNIIENRLRTLKVLKNPCINHPKERGIHKTPDGPMCNTCYDHFCKDESDYDKEYKG